MELWLLFGGERALYASLTLAALTWIISLLPPIVLRGRFGNGAGGLALPGLIFLSDWALASDEEQLNSVKRHEFVHIQQLRRYSPFVVSLMLAYHYTPWLMRRTRAHLIELYQSNPLEMEAYDKMYHPTPLMRHLDLSEHGTYPVFALGATWLFTLGVASIGLSYLVF